MGGSWDDGRLLTIRSSADLQLLSNLQRFSILDHKVPDVSKNTQKYLFVSSEYFRVYDI